MDKGIEFLEQFWVGAPKFLQLGKFMLKHMIIQVLLIF